jgi:hypothetical protein
MTTTDKISYASNATITCTLASLVTTSAGSARGSASVDNSANLYVDAILTIAVKLGSTGLGADKACYVYLYGAGQDGIYSGSSAEVEGTDAAVTIDSPTNLKGPFVIACPAVSTTYRLIVGSVASVFGGILPYKWGFVLQNSTGTTLDATEGNHTKDYTGIYYTNG